MNVYIWKEATIWTHTYDFQNDWALWWTTWQVDANSYNWYETWQWLYQRSASWTWAWWGVKMPNAITWTLKKVEIRWYKPNSAAAYWIDDWTSNYCIRCWANSNVVEYVVWWTSYTTWTTSIGEGKFTLEFWDGWVITWSYDSYTWTITSQQLIDAIRQAFNSGNLRILFSSWNANANAYVRKIQFTTED